MYFGIILALVLVLGLIFLYLIYVTGSQKSTPKHQSAGGVIPDVPVKWTEVQTMM